MNYKSEIDAAHFWQLNTNESSYVDKIQGLTLTELGVTPEFTNQWARVSDTATLNTGILKQSGEPFTALVSYGTSRGVYNDPLCPLTCITTGNISSSVGGFAMLKFPSPAKSLTIRANTGSGFSAESSDFLLDSYEQKDKWLISLISHDGFGNFKYMTTSESGISTYEFSSMPSKAWDDELHIGNPSSYFNYTAVSDIVVWDEFLSLDKSIAAIERSRKRAQLLGLNA